MEIDYSPLFIMSNAKIFLFTFFVILFVFFSISANSERIDSPRKKNDENDVVFFVFGDSLFDPGNNNYININISMKANRPPYGETFFNFPTGRFSDGRIIPDFIAMNMNLPLWKPYLGPNGTHIHSYRYGANFAAGAATVIDESNQGTDKYIISLNKQLVFFKDVARELRQQKGEREANRTVMNGIYWSSIGGVDYIDFVVENPNSSLSEKKEYVQLVIGNFTRIIKEIYEIGGRKFAFQNVGPMGCLPVSKQYFGLKGNACYEGLLDLAKLHNTALIEAIADLETQLDGFKYTIYDYYTALYDIIKNPAHYGFRVVDSACCGQGPIRGSNCGIEPYELCKNVNEYLFFDGSHTCERANRMLAQQMWNVESKMSTPYNFKQLYELNLPEKIGSSSRNGYRIAMKNVRVERNDFM